MRPSIHAFSDELQKIAKEDHPSPGLEIAKVIGSGVLGFGAGTAAGLGAGHLLDHFAQTATGNKIPKKVITYAAPLLGTAAGIAYSVQKAREQEAIRRALENSTNNSRRSVSG